MSLRQRTDQDILTSARAIVHHRAFRSSATDGRETRDAPLFDNSGLDVAVRKDAEMDTGKVESETIKHVVSVLQLEGILSYLLSLLSN